METKRIYSVKIRTEGTLETKSDNMSDFIRKEVRLLQDIPVEGYYEDFY